MPDKKILVTAGPMKNVWTMFLRWTGDNGVRDLFDVRALPGPTPIDWRAVVLYVPWVDALPGVWERSVELAAECATRGIPVINPPDLLGNARKVACSELTRGPAIRTPKTLPITDPEVFRDTLLGIPLPLFVRDEAANGGPTIRAETAVEARAIALGQYKFPIATELIDVRGGDGLYRKFRYIAAGAHGVSQSLEISQTWITKGDVRVVNAVTRAEELAYIARQDPNHAVLQQARRALGLDFLAFDYGYKAGALVVWEVNTLPGIQARAELAYRDAAIERTMKAMLRMYLERAGLPVPANMVDPYLA
jgi:hypothetical protein